MVKRLSFVGALLLAVSFVASIPARAVAAARDLFAGMVDFAASSSLRELFSPPALALVGEGLGSVEPSLAHRQRHEAGLARLGAVRHI